MRIYIESTIPSYVVARPARDLLQAARQQITKDWWDFKRGKHQLFISQVVLDEIAFGEAEMAQLRLERVQTFPVLQTSNDVKDLARKTPSLRLTGMIWTGSLLKPANARNVPAIPSWICKNESAQNVNRFRNSPSSNQSELA